MNGMTPTVSVRRAWVIGFALLAFLAGSTSRAAPDRNSNRFDEDAAWAFLERQVELGPRPAGSTASRRLAALLRASVPHGRFQAVPGGLRNVVATVPGREACPPSDGGKA